VRSAEVRSPVAVRFAWSGIAQPNFCNKADLPASPFRTDNWASVLEKK
jgi:sialate O-acetylesterase